MSVINELKSGSVNLSTTEQLVEQLEDAVGAYVLVPPVEYFVTFSSPSSFTIAIANSTKNWNGTLEYSTDKTNWNTWAGTSPISSGTNNELYLRGISNTYLTGSDDANKKWVLTGSNISIKGNIENLLDYATVELLNHPTMANHCFHRLFQGATALININNLELGATTLSQYCYARMFYGTSITKAPELPATTMQRYCYYSMFYNCANLTTASALPAMNLDIYCYQYMYGACTSLTTPPYLPATTLPTGCYQYMFSGCTSLNKLIKFPQFVSVGSYACGYTFYNCTSIKLSREQTGEYVNEYPSPNTRNTSDGYSSMFQGTGGTFTGGALYNETYYTSNEIIDNTEV